MAMQGPVASENLDISFRLQSKSQLFIGSNSALNGSKSNVVASASSHGIVFAASQNPELFVATLKDLEVARTEEQSLPVRKVPLPSPTSQIATNCDGTILAVALKINGTPHLQLYSVASFLTQNIQKIREFRLSADDSNAIQLCWNPVMSATLAVCTDSGVLSVHTMKEGGMELNAIDPNLKAKCCCWSPKGKQIVVGFGNGKLMQFTPELKPAKTIDCPPGVVAGTFDTIAIQWLSTFQFAVAFLSHQPDSRPILHIVNAPKGAAPQYIAYNDVCYSSTEARPSKIYLQHILPWNMLLVASANSIDVSFLRMTQAGDLPVWTQEFPHDQFPAELPLTPSRDESFPLGFELETGCSGKLLNEDGSPYPIMPMIHIMSTYGVLCSFYILNLTPSYVDICSPPRPLDAAALGLFKTEPSVATTDQPALQQQLLQTPPKEMPFSQPIGQSTPAVVKVQPTAKPTAFSLGGTTQPFGATASSFGAPAAAAAISFGSTTAAPSFGSAAATPAFGGSSGFGFGAATGFGANLSSNISAPSKPSAPPAQPKTVAPATVAPTGPAPVASSPAQPLITVPQTYTPSPTLQAKNDVKPQADKAAAAEDESLVYSLLIQDEMKAFELELRSVMEKSQSLKVNIGTKEESMEMRRNIEELDELKKEATETISFLSSDVQSNRLGITEMFSMVYEASSKFDHAKHDKSIFMNQSQVQDRASKRTLERLVKQLSHCEMQLQAAIQVMNSQWANYQEAVNKCKKNRMHNPSMEGLYQTLTKQQEIIYRQNEKVALLKTKLGLRDNILKQKSIVNPAMESFSDSMISISLADQVQSENSKLTNKKLKNLRNLLAGREVVVIKPQRPERPGLNSEIIREKKIQTLKTLKKNQTAKTTPVQVQQAPTVQKATTTGQQLFAPQQTTTSQQLFAGAQQSLFPSASTAKPTVPSGLSTSSSAPTFGATPPQQKSVPTFGLSTSNQKPSFGLSSAPLVLGIEKKRDEAAMLSSMQIQPPLTFGVSTATKSTPEIPKPSSTIANANVTVSASFSLPSVHKTSSSVHKEPSKVVEKKQDENQPPSTNENASFTFKLPEKKDESPVVTIKAPSGAPNFSSLLSGAGDSSKAFSFGLSSTTASPFSANSSLNDSKGPNSTLSATPSTTSVFSGFGSLPAVTSASVFSGFGATNTSTTPLFGGSTGFGGASSGDDANKSGFSLNLSSSKDSSKPATSAAFSFSSLSASTPPASSVSEAKPTATTTASSATKPATSFSFGSGFGTSKAPGSTAESTSTSSSFSFASAASTIAPTAKATGLDLSKPATAVATPPASPPSTDSVLKDLIICSPDAKPAALSPPANVFGSEAVKTDTSSVFGSKAFGATSPTVEANKTPASPSLFGSMSLGGDANKPSATSPPSGLFGSLVKPDQSVFSPTSAAPATTAASPFGGGFGSAAVTQSSSIFGNQSAAPAAAASIFGSATSQPAPAASIFGSSQQTTTQASAFGGSIFGQSTTPGATGGASLFSQSSFSSPPAASNVFGSSHANPSTGSIFGGASSFGATQPASGSIFGGGSTTSPFGSASVFGGGATFSNAFGSSTFGSGAPAAGAVFGQQAPTFGGQATFGSPKSNIFGQASTTSPSNNLFEQLGSQQSGGNLFGSVPAPQPAPQAGFQGSAFSSWR